MNKEDWHRLWLHFPWGLLAVLIYFGIGATAGITALAIECIYEGFNDWRKKDKSYKDVLGIAWGFLLPMGIIAIWRLLWRLL